MNRGAVELIGDQPLTTGRQDRWIPPAVRPPVPASDEPVRTVRLGAQVWTCRDGFDELLAGLAADQFADPQARGWSCVKTNPRRDVWRAEIAGRTFYLKYYRRRATDCVKDLFRGTACRVEWTGGLYALQHGLPAVRPVAYTPRLTYRGRPASLLVTEGLDRVCGLNEFWRLLHADDDLRRQRADVHQLIERLAEMIARAHQAGFEHLDMHAANILVQTVGPRRYRTLLVDLQCARLGMPVHDEAIVRNLAQLNQWFRKEATIGDRLRFLRAYLRWRNEYEGTFPHSRRIGLSFEQLVTALDRAAARHAERLWARRDRRCARSGRYVTTIRVAGGWRGMAYLRCKHPVAGSPASRRRFTRAEWQRLLPVALRAAREPRPDCKDSHSAVVTSCRLDHPDGPVHVIVKRPRPRNLRRRLRHLLGPSRARRGWQIAFALLNRDIPTPRPLAYLEQRLGPFVLDSALITERIADAQPLDAFLRQRIGALRRGAGFRQRRALTDRLARMLRKLIDRGFYHRDCKAGNILVAGQTCDLLWIDMDGIRHVGRLSQSQRLAPLVRLHVSLLEVPGLTRTDRVRFLKTHLARFGSDPRAWRRVWRAVEPLARAKQAALEERRRWKLEHYGRT